MRRDDEIEVAQRSVTEWGDCEIRKEQASQHGCYIYRTYS